MPGSLESGPAIQAMVNGAGDGSLSGQISFDALKKNQRAALPLAGGKVYIAFDSYTDTDPFHGWLFAYDASDLKSVPAVFNSTPNDSRGGIAESGAAPFSDVTSSSNVGRNVFIATSDGTPFDPNTGGDYPETLLKLQINAATDFSVADSFTPWNEATFPAGPAVCRSHSGKRKRVRRYANELSVFGLLP